MTWLSLAVLKTKNAQWLTDGLSFNCYKSWDSNKSENGQLQFMHMYASIHSINSYCQVPCVYCQEYWTYWDVTLEELTSERVETGKTLHSLVRETGCSWLMIQRGKFSSQSLFRGLCHPWNQIWFLVNCLLFLWSQVRGSCCNRPGCIAPFGVLQWSLVLASDQRLHPAMNDRAR